MSFAHCDICGGDWIDHGTACKPKASGESAASTGSEATVSIHHVFSHCITVEAEGLKIWLDRDQAIQLLEMLPTAINKMAVNLKLPNAEINDHANENQNRDGSNERRETR